MADREEITGIILAGGKSSRMGRDKGMIYFNGARMIEHVIRALQPCVSSIMIVANDDRYERFGLPVVKDVIHECGPMGGIYTGLINSSTKLNVVVSCDIPFVSTDLICRLVEAPDDKEVVVPFHDEIYEPLCARYRRSVALKMVKHLEAGSLKMNSLLKELDIRTIDPVQIPGFNLRQFANINTPQELNKYNDPEK